MTPATYYVHSKWWNGLVEIRRTDQAGGYIVPADLAPDMLAHLNEKAT